MCETMLTLSLKCFHCLRYSRTSRCTTTKSTLETFSLMETTKRRQALFAFGCIAVSTIALSIFYFVVRLRDQTFVRRVMETAGFADLPTASLTAASFILNCMVGLSMTAGCFFACRGHSIQWPTAACTTLATLVSIALLIADFGRPTGYYGRFASQEVAVSTFNDMLCIAWCHSKAENNTQYCASDDKVSIWFDEVVARAPASAKHWCAWPANGTESPFVWAFPPQCYPRLGQAVLFGLLLISLVASVAFSVILLDNALDNSKERGGTKRQMKKKDKANEVDLSCPREDFKRMAQQESSL